MSVDANDIEQAFIQRVCERLGERGIDTSDWDGDDDPAVILADCVAGRINQVVEWTQDLPIESGAYWHWNGDEDSSPIHIEVMYSGTDGSYFAPAGQWGWTRFQPVKEMGGWWAKLAAPALPKPPTTDESKRLDSPPPA